MSRYRVPVFQYPLFSVFRSLPLQVVDGRKCLLRPFWFSPLAGRVAVGWSIPVSVQGPGHTEDSTYGEGNSGDDFTRPVQTTHLCTHTCISTRTRVDPCTCLHTQVVVEGFGSGNCITRGSSTTTYQPVRRDPVLMGYRRGVDIVVKNWVRDRPSSTWTLRGPLSVDPSTDQCVERIHSYTRVDETTINTPKRHGV